jgi:hypothetical protein
VQFADGRKVTNLDRYPFVPEDLPPDQPVLVEAGVGGEGGRLGRGAIWDLELAVQPLPPPGPLAFVCAWPARGIPETRVEIDAYPTGFGFTLNLRLRNLHPGERRGFWPFPEFGLTGAPAAGRWDFAVDDRVRRWSLGEQP